VGPPSKKQSPAPPASDCRRYSFRVSRGHDGQTQPLILEGAAELSRSSLTVAFFIAGSDCMSLSATSPRRANASTLVRVPTHGTTLSIRWRKYPCCSQGRALQQDFDASATTPKVRVSVS
jgi:hypothetical protein